MTNLACPILILSALACDSLSANAPPPPKAPTPVRAPKAPAVITQPSFDEWMQTTSLLPTNLSLNANADAPAGLRATQFDDLLKKFRVFWRSEIASSRWQQNIEPAGQNENFFIEKLIVPAGSRVAFHGDLHGDIHSLMAFIADLRSKDILGIENGFQIVPDDFYIIFHGDFTDRGLYGTEVLATAIRLKLANPKHVFLVRGNHEDIDINRSNGFYDELQIKYGNKNADRLQNGIKSFYSQVPVALFLGVASGEKVDYLLCVHGGIELGFDHTPFLQPSSSARFSYLGALDRTRGFRNLPRAVHQAVSSSPELRGDFRVISSPTTEQIGFLWNDFLIDPNQTIVPTPRTEGSWGVGKALTEYYLQQPLAPNIRLRGIMRAHQHGDADMMAKILKKDERNEIQIIHPNLGISKLWTDDQKEGGQTMWDNIVVTLNVGADTIYAKLHQFAFHTFAILQTSEQFSDWRLTPVRVLIGI